MSGSSVWQRLARGYASQPIARSTRYFPYGCRRGVLRRRVEPLPGSKPLGRSVLPDFGPFGSCVRFAIALADDYATLVIGGPATRPYPCRSSTGWITPAFPDA